MLLITPPIHYTQQLFPEALAAARNPRDAAALAQLESTLAGVGAFPAL